MPGSYGTQGPPCQERDRQEEVFRPRACWQQGQVRPQAGGSANRAGQSPPRRSRPPHGTTHQRACRAFDSLHSLPIPASQHHHPAPHPPLKPTQSRVPGLCSLQHAGSLLAVPWAPLAPRATILSPPPHPAQRLLTPLGHLASTSLVLSKDEAHAALWDWPLPTWALTTAQHPTTGKRQQA